MSRFLSGLLNWFSRLRAPKAPAAPEYISDRGLIARFVFRTRDLTAKGLPKPKAFEPWRNAQLGRYETSVCGLNGVTQDRLWSLGRTVRARERLSAIAAIHLSVSKVAAVGLSCEAAPEPDFAEHGVIVGWSDDPEAKDERLAKQVELAAQVLPESVKRPPTGDR